MVVIRFDKSVDHDTGGVVCAALNVKLLSEKNITFGENSFRGDVYADFVDPAISQWESARESQVSA